MADSKKMTECTGFNQRIFSFLKNRDTDVPVTGTSSRLLLWINEFKKKKISN